MRRFGRLHVGKRREDHSVRGRVKPQLKAANGTVIGLVRLGHGLGVADRAAACRAPQGHVPSCERFRARRSQQFAVCVKIHARTTTRVVFVRHRLGPPSVSALRLSPIRTGPALGRVLIFDGDRPGMAANTATPRERDGLSVNCTFEPHVAAGSALAALGRTPQPELPFAHKHPLSLSQTDNARPAERVFYPGRESRGCRRTGRRTGLKNSLRTLGDVGR